MAKLTDEQYKNLKDLVYNFKTKNKQGFIDAEQRELLNRFPGINEKKYNEAIGVVTCEMDLELKQFIIYHDDIFTALLCVLEDREISRFEWD